MQEVWKNHEFASLGKIVSREYFFSYCASCVDVNSGFIATEVAPLGLSTLVNSSANSENVVALAAILRDVLSPGGSSESARAA